VVARPGLRKALTAHSNLEAPIAMNSEKILVYQDNPAPGQPRSPRIRLSWILNLLLVYLAAVTIFGKGPTYLGVGSLYWGEGVLFLSLLWALRHWNRGVIRTGAVKVLTLLIICFLLLGTVELVRDYPVWGLDSLRDSAIWYYALFYFVGLTIASNEQVAAVFRSRWKRFWIVSVIWGCPEILSSYRLSALGPILSGTGPLLAGSGLETIQSMGLGSVLLLTERGRGWLKSTTLRVMLAVLGLVTAGVYYGRGGKLSVLAAFAVVISASLRQGSFEATARRRTLWAIMILILGAFVAEASGLDLTRSLSLDRFEGASFENPDDTAGWRTVWWDSLYDHVMIENPVFGMGFGENLADYNPYITEQGAKPVRAPHNFNVTVFSRMGIAGAALWAGIFFLGVIVPYWDVMSGSMDRAERKERAFWIAVVVAIWVNSSFGVLMEGPVCGIPFWLVVGLIAGKPHRSRPRRESQIVVGETFDANSRSAEPVSR
jgi:hypothetical protein